MGLKNRGRVLLSYVLVTFNIPAHVFDLEEDELLRSGWFQNLEM